MYILIKLEINCFTILSHSTVPQHARWILSENIREQILICNI